MKATQHTTSPPIQKHNFNCKWKYNDDNTVVLETTFKHISLL